MNKPPSTYTGESRKITCRRAVVPWYEIEIRDWDHLKDLAHQFRGPKGWWPWAKYVARCFLCGLWPLFWGAAITLAVDTSLSEQSHDATRWGIVAFLGAFGLVCGLAAGSWALLKHLRARDFLKEMAYIESGFGSFGGAPHTPDYRRVIQSPEMLEGIARFHAQKRDRQRSKVMGKERRRTRCFKATASDGSARAIDEYTTFIKAGTREDPNARIECLKEFRTDDGRAVNRLEKGKYQVVDTGEILTSDYPSAP